MKTFNGILKKKLFKALFKKGILYHVSTSPFPFQSVFPFFSVCFERTIGWNLQDIKGSLNGQPTQTILSPNMKTYLNVFSRV